MMKGIITEVQGPVVDVLFPEGQLPFIKDALTVQNGEQKCVMEVAQHMAALCFPPVRGCAATWKLPLKAAASKCRWATVPWGGSLM